MASDTVTVRYEDNDGFGDLLDGLHMVKRSTGDGTARYSVEDLGSGQARVTVFGTQATVDKFNDWLSSEF